MILSTLLLTILLTAILYSSVGHGGASGYLAAMVLFGLDPEVMRPAALVMNIGVSSLVLLRMSRIGAFDWDLFRPIAIGSIPAATLGGALHLDAGVYRDVMGGLLIVAACLMFLRARADEYTVPVRSGVALAVGAVLGLVSGLTGVGGGIYLSPLLLFLHWTDMRGSVVLAAMFIWVNSLAGLLGYMGASAGMPEGMLPMLLAAMGGALVGSELAARRLAPAGLRRLLGVVLLIAGGHSILT